MVATKAFMNKTVLNRNLDVTVFKRITGAIFCHVKKINLIRLLRVTITGAPQKCIGASLALSNNPNEIHLLK